MIGSRDRLPYIIQFIPFLFLFQEVVAFLSTLAITIHDVYSADVGI